MLSTINTINATLYNLLIWLLMFAGIFFTVRFKGVQFRYFRHIFKNLSSSKDKSNTGISSFQAFCTGLAARVGTGNLSGVAIALYSGGEGAIFWMWVASIVGMSTGFVESTLAQAYKIKDKQKNLFYGGPSYYITKGLGQKWIGIIFAVLFIFCYAFAFTAVQANTITIAIQAAFGIDKAIVGISLAIISSIIIYGGINTVARIASLIVPPMALIYLAIALIVILMNFYLVLEVFQSIISHAFTVKAGASGSAGYLIGQTITTGIQRGLFSNEAGMGSIPNLAATADVKHPVSQGLAQMFGVFVDTILVCTATALIILFSGKLVPGSGITGIHLTQIALSSQVGHWGNAFIAIILLLFGFTTILGNYALAEINLYFIKSSKIFTLLLRMLSLVGVICGTFMSLPLAWAIGDFFMFFITTINLIAILLLSNVAYNIFQDYEQQLKLGNDDPTFKFNT